MALTVNLNCVASAAVAAADCLCPFRGAKWNPFYVSGNGNRCVLLLLLLTASRCITVFPYSQHIHNSTAASPLPAVCSSLSKERATKKAKAWKEENTFPRSQRNAASDRCQSIIIKRWTSLSSELYKRKNRPISNKTERESIFLQNSIVCQYEAETPICYCKKYNLFIHIIGFIFYSSFSPRCASDNQREEQFYLRLTFLQQFQQQKFQHNNPILYINFFILAIMWQLEHSITFLKTINET